jgi:hypothetical protein
LDFDQIATAVAWAVDAVVVDESGVYGFRPLAFDGVFEFVAWDCSLRHNFGIG